MVGDFWYESEYFAGTIQRLLCGRVTSAFFIEKLIKFNFIIDLKTRVLNEIKDLIEAKTR